MCTHTYKWYMCACLSTLQHASGGQRTTWKNSLNLWVLGIKLRPPSLGRCFCLLSQLTSLETQFIQASITMCHYLRVPKAKDHCCSCRQQRSQPPSSTCQTHLGSPSSPWLSSSSSLPLYSYSVSSAKETTDTFPLTAPASTLGRETSAGNVYVHSPTLELQVWGKGSLGRETGVREGKGRPKDLMAREGTGQRCHPNPLLPTHPLTFLTPLLPGAVNVVLELDADLPLRGLVTDEGKFE